MAPSSSTLHLQLQSTLGERYNLERELGGAGMSRVFVAEEPRLGRKVVVKVLAPELVAGVSVGRFEREIRLAGSLQQANIVPVLTAGEVDGLPYYTMPFVDGESLRARLADGPLRIAEAVSILRDVARALAYAHRRGVVHRDVKPDNVLLSEGAAVVTDFGIAKALSASRTIDTGGATLTRIGTSIGTPAYMAPEQAAGDPDVDHRADLYAFGAMAYELLAGRPPFHDLPPHRLLAAQLGEHPAHIRELRPDTPPALAELVMRCLEKDTDARPQSAAALVQVLDGVASGGAHAAASAALLGGRGTFRRALLFYAAALVAVMLLTWAASAAIGLPRWVVPGALVMMALGLPVILFTGFVHHTVRRTYVTTPTRTPGGSPAPPSTMAALAARVSPHVSWRRAMLGGVVAASVFALVVAGYMLSRALGVGPAGSLLAAGKIKDREPVLVTDFRATGADSALGGVAGEAVRTTLAQSSAVSVLPASAVTAALARMERPPTSRIDLPLAREIAAREGIGAIVDGGITPVGGGYIVTLRLLDARTGDELASYRETADGLRELLPTLDALGRRMRERMGESLKRVRGAPPLEQVTTPSLAALRKYVEGSRANENADLTRAASLLREAVAIDTGFAMAYRKLGVVLSNASMPQASIDSAVERAYRYRDRLGERERLLTTAAYFEFGPGHDRRRAIEAYEALLALEPNDGTALNNLANLYGSRREWARAESLFQRNAALDRNPQSLGNLAVAQFSAGELAAAESTAVQGLRQFPNAGMLMDVQLAFLYQRGLADSMATRLEAMRRDPDPMLRLMGTFGRAELALLRGQLRDWERLRAEARAIHAEQGAPPRPLQDSLASAWADIWFRNQHARGVRRLDSALARMPVRALPMFERPAAYLEAAAYYAQGGRADRARDLLARYEADVRDSVLRRVNEPAWHHARGEIALAEGRPRDALAEFTLGDRRPDGPADECASCLLALAGRAYDRAGMPDSVIAAYERYLVVRRRMGWKAGGDPMYLAGIQKRLGDLYDARSDRARAAEHYARFVELWRDADPELQPSVAAVRQRLAILGDDARG